MGSAKAQDGSRSSRKKSRVTMQVWVTRKIRTTPESGGWLDWPESLRSKENTVPKSTETWKGRTMGNNEKTGKINRLVSGKHSYPLPQGRGGTVPIWHKWTSREYKGQRRTILKELGKMPQYVSKNEAYHPGLGEKPKAHPSHSARGSPGMKNRSIESERSTV